MIDSELALLGGNPIRRGKYPNHTTKLDNEEKEAIREVLEDGELSGFSGRIGDRFLGGRKVKELEAKIQLYFGVKHAITFNSATSALHGAVTAAGIGRQHQRGPGLCGWSTLVSWVLSG